MFRVEVSVKSGFPDPRGEALKADIRDLGISAVQQARVSDVYLLDCDEKALNEAMGYTTDSGKVLGELGPDELVEMVDKIGELPDPSLKMLTIKQHCLTLLDYLKSLEVAESE